MKISIEVSDHRLNGDVIHIQSVISKEGIGPTELVTLFPGTEGAITANTNALISAIRRASLTQSYDDEIPF
jgi:hypothetical protein